MKKIRLISILTLVAVILMGVFGNQIYSYDKTYTVYMVGQGHLDTGWTWDWPTTIDDLFSTVDKQLTNINSNSDFHFTFPAMLHYKWLKEYDLTRFNNVKTQITNGKWEVTGGQWVEPDTNLTWGESEARQFLIGKLYARSELGVDPKMGYLPDTFGHPWTLPQILNKSGMDFFLETKLDGQSNVKPPYLCQWQASDGTKILTINGFMYNSAPGDVTWMNGTMDRAAGLGFNKAMRTYGDGDGGGGPTQTYINSIHTDNTTAGGPAVSCTTMQAYYDAIKNDSHIAGLSTWNDELYLESRRGIYSNNSAGKYLLRKNDVKIDETEKAVSISNWLGATGYQNDKMASAWDITLTNEFHDHIYGTWCTNATVDRVINNYGVGGNLLDNTLNYALDGIAGRADTTATAGYVPILVFNPLSWTRNDVVETSVTFGSAPSSVRVYDDAGTEVPTQVISINGNTAQIIFEANNVPSIGFKVFKAASATAGSYSTGLSIGSNIIQNNYVRATINGTTGNLSSVYLKGSSWEAIKSGAQANELHYLTDTANARDLNQNEMEATPTLVNNISNLTVVESGPVRAIYRFNKSTPAGSAITQYIIMYSNIDRVDIKNSIDWNEQNKMLKVSFPFNLSPTACTYEIPYGTIDRPVTRNTNLEKTKYEVSGHKWADMSAGGYGVSILNDSKYGWDALNNRLRLSLHRSPNVNDTRYEVGHYDTVYSIYPHAGDWKSAGTVREANQLNYPLIAKPTTQHSGALGKTFCLASVDQPNIMLTAVKKVEDSASNDLVVRLVEINGVTSTNYNVTFAGNITAASKVNLIEDNIGTVSYSTNTLSSTVGYYGIQSFRVTVSSPNYSNTKPVFTKANLASAFNVDGFSKNSARNNGNLDGNGNTLPAELIPVKVVSEDIEFDTGSTTDGALNVIKCAGQTVGLPQNSYKNLYLLATSAGGVATESGSFKVNYTDGSNTTQTLTVRDWTSKILVWGSAAATDNIAYIVTHRHTSAADDKCKWVYLYKYAIPLNTSKTVSSILLPNYDKIKILAISLENASSGPTPTPAPTATPPATPTPTPTPASVIVSLTSSYNQDAYSYDSNRADGNYDGASATYPADSVITNPSYDGIPYQLGPLTNGSNNAIKGTGQTITLTQGVYSSIRFLGSGTNGDKTGTFRITYTDNSYTDVSVTQLDWRTSASVSGEKVVETMTHKHTPTGDSTVKNTYIFAYYLTPTAGKTVKSLSLPNDANIHVLAITLVQ
jgi:alpha-mannosidase